jgi:hypothetical protein
MEVGEKAVKFQHAADRIDIPNPTAEYMTLFHQGTPVEQFLKWILSLKTIMQGHTISERYGVVPKSLKGTDKDLWQRVLNESMHMMNEVATPELEREALFEFSLDRRNKYFLDDELAGVTQARCIKYYLWIGHLCVRAFYDRLEEQYMYAFIPPYQQPSSWCYVRSVKA